MTLYNILLIIAIIMGLPIIIPSVLLSGKRRKTFFQRLGLKSIPAELKQNRFKKQGERPVWIHALSVGEVLSSATVVKTMKKNFRNKEIIFSASTKTGFEIANNILKEDVDSIIFFPYDIVFSVKNVANKINPEIVIIVETDIWPNFLSEMKKQNIPVIFINARLSENSFRRYSLFSFFTGHLFTSLSKICTQTAEDARRFRSLGVPPENIVITGNVKFDQTYEFVSEQDIKNIRRSMNIRPSQKILLAGSTHKGEEIIILDAFAKIRNDFHELALIIVPRDPERSGEVCNLFQTAGYSAVLMKELNNIDKNKKQDVIVIDVIGILKKLYSVADIAFIGGSLVDFGGHNPLEPAAFSKPVIFGQYMSDFREISQMFLEAGGAVIVKDSDSLSRTIGNLLKNREKAHDMGHKAYSVFKNNKGAVHKTLSVVERVMKLKS